MGEWRMGRDAMRDELELLGVFMMVMKEDSTKQQVT